MKRIVLLLCYLFLLYLNSFAQLKHFFPNSNSCFSVSYMKFWFEGDTVFNDMKYKKVYMQYEEPVSDFDNAHYFAAIREDTIAEKIYFYYNNYAGDGEEYLLYDFSVNEGESVSFYSLWGFMTPNSKEQVVQSIDSIYVDGHYRKRINFLHDIWSHPSQESWIEGIGSTNGLFFPGIFDKADVMDWTHLLCVHIDRKLIYHAEDYCDCFVSNYLNIEEYKEDFLKIYPTVTDNLLHIETYNSIENFNYKIINLQGKLVKKELLIANIIDVSNLEKGFYFVLISDNKSKKIIKITINRFKIFYFFTFLIYSQLY